MPPTRKRKQTANLEETNKENTVNSRNMICTAALAVACLFSTAAVHGQGAAGAATGTKIGTINIRQAIVTTAEGKQASAELQSQFAPRQTEIENMNKQINDLRQRLAACEGKCSQDEIQRLTAQGQRLTTQFDRKNNELQEDSNAALCDVIDRIGRKMMDVLDRYARENGFIAVFDSSAQSSPIIYAANSIDITQDIIRLYDQAYPAKGGAAPAAKPAAATPSKPAAPAPAKP